MISDLPLPEKRRPLTRAQVIWLCQLQAGVIAMKHGGSLATVLCGCGCGDPLKPTKCIDEHLNPLDSMGSNSIKNRALYNTECAKRKTKKDKKASAKGARLRKETCTGPRRKIVSRGFDKTRSRGFDGKIRERTPSPANPQPEVKR